MIKYLLLFSLLLNNTAAFAKKSFYTEMETKLNSLPPNLRQKYASDIGLFCEYIAKQIIDQKYPSHRFFVESNLSYEDNNGRRQGEIDLVVFDKTTRQAQKIIEVKCRKNRQKALKKARQQLERFKGLVQNSTDSTGPIIKKYNRFFSPTLFKSSKYVVMMPKYSTDNHANQDDFNMTLDDVYHLQYELSKEFDR